LKINEKHLVGVFFGINFSCFISNELVMNALDTLPVESFSLVNLKDSIGNAIQGQVNRIERTGAAWMKSLSITFLKSHDEIEEEFWREEARNALVAQQTRNNRDGYLNINLEGIDSGFMEENY
jgi:hypothetical protein